eukprot:CAMPEP_0170319434 /NCGR_PEP_ID=MMETSP0116_2-20130129/60432_1 /TAXON_ID=400756 /ORGANISM="Durinskia baltica, Strain CSIRO CS-38" /LENGTH=50 /DNA_ID=CAMNT_0010572167 /DNA_START=82 /DNA_END=230 /DNA_ORIENTATION=+
MFLERPSPVGAIVAASARMMQPSMAPPRSLQPRAARRPTSARPSFREGEA